MNDFYWGTATSAFQIEGAANLDGRTPSIWDTYTLEEGKILNHDDGRKGIDHYHLFKTDLKYLKELGVNSYRFSISWSRIIPNADGKINEKGMAFYERILQELVQYQVRPFITFYHWDLPMWLQDMGGWTNRNTAFAFADFVAVITQRFKQYCHDYITINEPQCIINLGHKTLEHAPGIFLEDKEAVISVHNLLLAHGLAVQAIRKIDREAKIGFAATSSPAIPIDDNEENIDVARRCYFSLTKGHFDQVTLYSDPIFLGDYPKEFYDYYQPYLPATLKEDLVIISSPIDYCYQNIYSGYFVKANEDKGYKILPYSEENPAYVFTWLHQMPKTLYYGPKFLYERYQKPIIISENGISVIDVLTQDHKIHDYARIEYYRRYLEQMEKAQKDGIPIKGYFAWSLFDNFEWAFGYSARFGLIYVDYQSMKRYPKDSFYFYQKYIADHQE